MKRGNPWVVLLTLSLGFFMTLLDLTAVNVAIPSMIDTLHASLDEVLWVINVYVLALAALLITSGRLGDAYGPRTMFVWGVTLFTVASVLCGLSRDPAQLIAARAVQGLGAAALVPQTMTLIFSTFPAQRRGTAGSGRCSARVCCCSWCSWSTSGPGRTGNRCCPSPPSTS